MSKNSHRTIIEDRTMDWSINYTDRYWCIGSCFAQQLHNYLTGLKFDVLSHPFGIVYNPITIATQVSHIIEGNPYTLEDLEVNRGLWSSAMHHSSYNSLDPDEMLLRINSELDSARNKLESLQGIIITLGTSFMYREKKSGLDVSNCHKRSASLFEKRACDLIEMSDGMIAMLNKLIAINPSIKIIISVSPIRHIKNGLIPDQRSKSTLLLTAHRICDYFDSAIYFPAYDIMMNDLRDYRYYARDMIHPNELAIDYILDYFSNQCFNADAHIYIKEVSKIKAQLGHRPFNKDSNDYKEFKSKLLVKMSDASVRYPHLKFQDEISRLNSIK